MNSRLERSSTQPEAARELQIEFQNEFLRLGSRPAWAQAIEKGEKAGV